MPEIKACNSPLDVYCVPPPYVSRHLINSVLLRRLQRRRQTDGKKVSGGSCVELAKIIPPIQQWRRQQWRRVKTARRRRLIFQVAERALCRARGPVMNYTGAHSLWEIWTVLGVSGGMEGGFSDKLPSLPVSLAPLSFLCSRRSSSEGRGLFYQVEVILSSVRHFGGDWKKK